MVKLNRAGTTGYPSGRKLSWSLFHITEKKQIPDGLEA